MNKKPESTTASIISAGTGLFLIIVGLLSYIASSDKDKDIRISILENNQAIINKKLDKIDEELDGAKNHEH